MIFVLVYFRALKRNPVKVIARAPISQLDKCRKYNHLIGYISNSNFKFKFSNSKQTFVFNLPVFAAKRIFKTYQHFCFLCFRSRGRFFWFHRDREITKSLFTLAESNFSERKLSCTRLNFGEILEFAAYCPLAELAI